MKKIIIGAVIAILVILAVMAGRTTSEYKASQLPSQTIKIGVEELIKIC